MAPARTQHTTILTAMPRSLILLLAWLVVGVTSQCMLEGDDVTCSRRVTYLPGDVTLGVLVNIHHQDKSCPCQQVQQSTALTALQAVTWVFQSLNQAGFIPGINLGVEAYDSCGREDAAQASLLELVPSTVLSGCGSLNSNVIGFLGLFDSGQAMATATSLNGSSLPLLSSTATATSLDDRIKYPNFFRTVTSNAYHIKVLEKLILQLGWRYVAVVHSDDAYGSEGAEEFVTMATQHDICIGYKKSLPRAGGSIWSVVVGELIHLLQNVDPQAPYLGVIFYGQQAAAQHLIRLAASWTGFGDVHRLIWIFPDSIGSDDSIFQDYPEIAQNVISIAPSSQEIPEFDEHWVDLIYDAVQNTNNNSVQPWVEKYILNTFKCSPGKCPSVTRESIKDVYIPPIYLFQHIVAAFVYAKIIKDVVSMTCDVNNGGCGDDVTVKFSNKPLDAMRHVDFKFWDGINDSIFHPFLPEVLKSSKYHIKFDNMTGGIIHENDSPTHFVHNIKCRNEGKVCHFQKVGEYFPYEESLVLNLTEVTLRPSGDSIVSADMLHPVVCVRDCDKCQISIKSTQFVYIPGDYILLGIFSIHSPSISDPFGCSNNIRMEASIQLMEAFLMMIQKVNLNRPPGSPTWGAIALDSCYNGLLANSLVSRFFSGDLVLKHNGSDLDPNRVVGVIGGHSSGISEMLLGLTNALHLIQVSYAATSTKLFNYSNFLRTLPADDAQTKAMVQLIKDQGWNAFSILYREGPYGHSGYLAIKEHAREMKLCITFVEAIKRNPNDVSDLTLTIARLLGHDETRAVILFMSDAEVKEVLTVAQEYMNRQNIKEKPVWIGTEGWANRMSILDNSTSQARGSLTLQIQSRQSQEFRKYYTDLDPWNNTSNPFFSKYWEAKFNCYLPNMAYSPYTELCFQNKESLADDYQQDTYVAHVIDAVLATTKGLSQILMTICEHNPGPNCDLTKLRTETNVLKVVEAVRASKVSSGGATYHPITSRGDGSAPYVIYNVQQNQTYSSYIEIGLYDHNSGSLQMFKNKTIQFYNTDGDTEDVMSVCKDKCEACASEDGLEDLWRRHVFVNGDCILASLMPLHTRPHSVDEKIGDVCTKGLLALEAFMWAVQQVNQNTELMPGIDLGYQVLDTFSDAETAVWQATGLLGPSRYLHLRNADIDPDNVLGFITGSQNDVTKALQEVTSRHRLVQLDYLSTLSLPANASRSTYFIRQSQSSVDELRDLTKVLIDAGWTRVSVVYGVPIWGSDGKATIEEVLIKEGMCCNEFIPLTDTSKVHSIVSSLQSKPQSQTHVMLMLVTEEQTKELMPHLRSELGFEYDESFLVLAGGHQFMQGLDQVRTLDLQFTNKIIGLKSAPVELDAKLKLYLKSLTESENPWWKQEAWSEAIKNLDGPSSFHVKNIIDAVNAFAMGLTDILPVWCPGEKGLCKATKGSSDFSAHLVQYVRSASERIQNSEDQGGSIKSSIHVIQAVNLQSSETQVGKIAGGTPVLEDKSLLYPVKEEYNACNESMPPGLIALCVLLPLLALVITVTVVVLCWRKRKRLEGKVPSSPTSLYASASSTGMDNHGFDAVYSGSLQLHNRSSPSGSPPPVPSPHHRLSVDELRNQHQLSSRGSPLSSQSSRVESHLSNSSRGASTLPSSSIRYLEEPSMIYPHLIPGEAVHHSSTLPSKLNTFGQPVYPSSMQAHGWTDEDLHMHRDHSDLNPSELHNNLDNSPNQYMTMTGSFHGMPRGVYYPQSTASDNTEYAYNKRYPNIYMNPRFPHSDTASTIIPPQEGTSADSSVIFENESNT